MNAFARDWVTRRRMRLLRSALRPNNRRMVVTVNKRHSKSLRGIDLSFDRTKLAGLVIDEQAHFTPEMLARVMDDYRKRHP